MNNNVGSVVVVAATKHRDPKSLLGYITKGNENSSSSSAPILNTKSTTLMVRIQLT